jgi:hypothetical protein
MRKRRPEVADVLREYGPEFVRTRGRSIGREARRVLTDLTRCRTAALGGHRLRCSHCGHEEISYNSCRNRHCPKCQASGRARWLDRETEHLLEVPYFHVVFTLPAELSPVVLQNRRHLYGALFSAAADTLATLARDPRHLGADIGFLMVLHTWGQNLRHHPHVHGVVPAGGISPDRRNWIGCRKDFFLPVRVMSRLFRGKYLNRLERLRATGELTLSGSLASLRDSVAWNRFVSALRRTEWVVYCKPPFGGSLQVLKYLARYTHRVAISNRRILSIDRGRVRFRWKDYAHAGKQRVMELEATEFIRRFLLHVLPKGFVRIRHYGFLSNRSRTNRLALARRLLEESRVPSPSLAMEKGLTLPSAYEPTDPTCPCCKKGLLLIVQHLGPSVLWSLSPEYVDTS